MIVKSEKNEAYQQAKTELESLQKQLKEKKEEVLKLRDELDTLENTLGIDELSRDPNWDKIQRVKADYLKAKRQADILAEQIHNYDEFKKIAESVSSEAVKAGQKINKGFITALEKIEALRAEYQALLKAYKPYHKLLNTNENSQAIIGRPLPTDICSNPQTNVYRGFIKDGKEYQMKYEKKKMKYEKKKQ